MDVPCINCGLVNVFEQPYPYHAGFADQGFLYNEAGNLTLVWGAFDPLYRAIVGNVNPWMLTQAQRSQFEQALKPAPSGGRWLFANPARCKFCDRPIKDPMGPSSIYYLVYPGSIVTDGKPGTVVDFATQLNHAAGAT